MRSESKTVPLAGTFLLRGFVGTVLLAGTGVTSARLMDSSVELEAAQAQVPVAVPPFIYGSGPQGFGYYPNPAFQAAPAPVQQVAPQARPATVGPGARNWATGNRSPLHRPWLRSR